MATVAASIPELVALLDGTARIEGDRLVVTDEAAFRGRTIEDLAWTQTFSDDATTVEAARWIIWEASQALGARSASIQELYAARARGEVQGFTVPAINIRIQTFDMAKAIFATARAKAVGPVILELARSEQTYTWQRVFEYAPNCLAGAIAAGWVGPVFIQGDHYQFNAKKYAADPEAVTEEIRKACRDAMAAGYLNIDIDSSTLVDLSKATVDEQQRANYTRAAEITALIRDLEPAGVTISIGGEIGEVGKQNSNEQELRAYLDGFRRELDARAPGALGVSKVSVQTGHEPRRRAAAGRRRGRGEARLRGPPRPRRGRPDLRCRGRGPARREHPARTASSTPSPRSRRPRSTWPRASRTPSTSTPPSRPISTPRSRRGASPTPSTSARTG